MLIYARKIFGMNFYSQKDKVGIVQDMNFYEHNWCIKNFILEKHSAFDFGFHDHFEIPADKVKISNMLKNVLVTGMSIKEIHEHQTSPKEKITHLDYDMFTFFGWSNYWNSDNELNQEEKENQEDYSISLKEIIGFKVDLINKEMGFVYDFLIDSDDWKIVNLVTEVKESILHNRKMILNVDNYLQVHPEKSLITVRHYV